jgi:TolA-binding protein
MACSPQRSRSARQAFRSTTRLARTATWNVSRCNSQPRREVQRMALLLDEIARLEQLEKELRRVAVRLDSINTRRNQQSQTVQQLQAELRRRDVQVKALEQELESLKAIDLRLRQRRPAIPPQ